jgi:hypothetical protein
MNFPLTAHHEVANRQRACAPLRCAAFWVLRLSCVDQAGLHCASWIAESEAAADTPKCRRLDPCTQPISTGSGDQGPKARTLDPPKLPTKSSSAPSLDLNCPLRAGPPAIPIALSHRTVPGRSFEAHQDAPQLASKGPSSKELPNRPKSNHPYSEDRLVAVPPADPPVMRRRIASARRLDPRFEGRHTTGPSSSPIRPGSSHSSPRVDPFGRPPAMDLPSGLGYQVVLTLLPVGSKSTTEADLPTRGELAPASVPARPLAFDHASARLSFLQVASVPPRPSRWLVTHPEIRRYLVQWCPPADRFPNTSLGIYHRDSR